MARVSRPAGVPVRRASVCCEPLESRRLMTIAATAPLPDVTIPLQQGATQIKLSNFFAEASPASNMAFLTTNLGVIPIQLTPQTAPKTVANFESYVNSGAYNGTIINESQPGSFVQAGTYNISAQLNAPGAIASITQAAPVANEFAASNVRGTIATALQTTDPNSATDGFILNESDSNAASFDSSKLTVFGNVVGSAGLAVLDQIGAVPVPNPGPYSTLPGLPLLNYTSGSQAAFNQFVKISSVSLGSEGFFATSDNPAVAFTDLTGDTLAITPLAAGTANITVTGVGSDGTPVSQTFAVAVGAALPATPGTPAAKGTLPSTIVAGQPAKIHLTATLTATQDLNTTTQTSLLLTASTSFGVQYTVALANSKLKLKSGKHASLNLSAKLLPADLPGGTYFVGVSITAADSQPVVIGTNQSITVEAPTVNLGGSFKTLTTKAKAGHSASAIFVVTNSGNAPASGLLKLNVTNSTDNSLLTAPIKKVTIKPGKSVSIRLTWPAGVAGDQYQVNVAIDPEGVFKDINLSDNVVVSVGTVIVS